MGTSQPIRSLDELTAFRSYYLNKEVNLRNYMLICMGLNTALRISDMLQLKWGNVYDFDRKHYVKHIVVCEGKTGKETRIAINNNLIEAFAIFMVTTCIIPIVVLIILILAVKWIFNSVSLPKLQA